MTRSIGCWRRLRFALAIAAIACASANTGATSAAGQNGRDRSVMDATDLIGHNYANVYQAVFAAHPEWFRVVPTPQRGPTSPRTTPAQGESGIPVFVDDSPQPQTLEYLRGVQPEQVLMIKHLTGSESLAAFGPQWTSGALRLTTRP